MNTAVRPRITWKIVAGEPLSHDGMTITPQMWMLIIRLPWGFVFWKRPVAVLVEAGERTYRRPIFDVTLGTQMALLAAAIGLWVFGIRRHRRRNR